MNRAMVLLVFMVTCLGSNGWATALDTTPHSVSVDLIDNRVLPAYRSFHRSADNLNTLSRNFCEQITVDNLSALRGGFSDLIDQWAAIQHFQFGPVEFLFRWNRIQYWPDKHNVVSKQLREFLKRKNRKVLLPENFSGTSVGVQGVGALERLIFVDQALEKFTDNSEGRYRCLLLQAISVNIRTIAYEILDDWENGDDSFYSMIDTAKDGNDFFDSSAEVNREIMKNLRTALLTVAELKLGRPLGNGEKPRPRRAELWRSQKSLQIISINVQSVALYFSKSTTSNNFSSLAKSHDASSQAAQIEETLQQALAMLHGITLPIQAALADDIMLQQLRAVRGKVKEGIRLLEQFAVTLEMPLGFNSLDGD